MFPSDSSPSPVSPRDVFIVTILIAGVCFLTLTPAMYLAFQALRWTWATRLVEGAFMPALFLTVLAGLIAYKRAQARRALLNSDDSND
jgi:Kef-type K+ transport system membrane component KefB